MVLLALCFEADGGRHLDYWLNYDIVVLYPISLYSDINYDILVQLRCRVFHDIVYYTT